MKRSKFLSPINYFLLTIIVILLIVLKQMDNRLTNLESQQSEQEKTTADQVEKPKTPHPVVKPQLTKGTIGLIIDDFGYRNDEVTKGFLNLNANLTYAVIPGHEHSTSFGEDAVKAGYEVIVHMPLENLSNLGGEEEFVLTTTMDSETIQKRVKLALDQIPTAIGMNNHQGSKASANQHVMSNIARVMKNRNLFFIDSRTTAETVAESTMEVYGVPTARRNVFLDNDDDISKIQKQLDELVQKAEEWGSAIGIGHVKPKTLSVLEKQIPELRKKGFKFEFVSKMLH